MTRGRHPEREDKLIAAIRAAGSIRTKELSDATGVQGNNIGTALAGDVKKLRLAIDQDGSLQLGDDTDPAQFVFLPEQVLQLGDFLHGTQGIWRP